MCSGRSRLLPGHKGTFPEKSCGPYVVTRKLGEAHVILQDPETGLMVDKGVPVPMDQIIIFPYRKPCTFFEGGEEAEREMRPDKGTEPDLNPRTWSQMLSGVGAPSRDDDAGIPYEPNGRNWLLEPMCSIDPVMSLKQFE